MHQLCPIVSFSHGYAPFFQAIQPQLNSLRTFLLQQSKTSAASLPSQHPSALQQGKKATPPSSGSLGSLQAAAAASASPILANSSRKCILSLVLSKTIQFTKGASSPSRTK